MTRFLLDTTFLIDYLTGDPGVRSFLEAHEADEFVTTPINVKETVVGQRLHHEFDPEEFSATFDWVEVAPLTVDHALAASAFEADLFRSDEHTRRAIDAAAADLLIAAVAAVEDVPVVTRNTDDFVRFDVHVTPY